MLRDKVVFLVSPEEWDFIFVSKHHYAMELAARGNKVFFINPPKKGVPGKLSIHSAANIPDLYIVDYSTRIRGLRFLPAFLRRWADRHFLKSVEKKAGVRFDVLWNFENSRFFDLRFAGADLLKIYFQVDEDQDFHIARATATADIALAINTEIFEIIKPFNKNCFQIPHSFQGNLSNHAKKVQDGTYSYKKPDGPLQIYYAGNLQHGHINIDLFEKVVAENKNVEFRLVGPYDTDKELFQRLRKYSHVYFTGKVPYTEIPILLDKADAVILIYDSDFTQSSHKLLEYLASGKAIISTYMTEHDTDDPLIYISRSDDEYLQTFQQVISEIEKCNRPDLMRRRIDFAMDHTYAKQLDKLEKLIAQSARQ